jgi:hypothetical protein
MDHAITIGEVLMASGVVNLLLIVVICVVVQVLYP